MHAEYDHIAEQYRTAKLHPWRLHLEVFTFLDLAGDLAGKSVLDLACGEGFYTRILKQRGAARVVGVDLSSEMIRLAREEESRRPLGVEYRVGDARAVNGDEQFDLVVAAYLFNYAKCGDEMAEMARAAAHSLSSGCRLVAINNDQEQPVEAFAGTQKYGLSKSASGPLRDGTPITYTISNNGHPFHFDNYYLSTATQEEAFRRAGFGPVRWHRPRLSPNGEREYGADYWADFVRHPPVVFIECRKGG